MKLLPDQILTRLEERLARLYGEDKAPRLLHRLSVLAQRYDLTFRKRPRPTGRLWDEGDVLLITYGDMVRASAEPPLATLQRFLRERLGGSIRIVHLLPFFPYSSDEGFSVIDYRKVDEALGSWHDIHAIGQDFDLMFDLVLNHTSGESHWFSHYINGTAPYRDYFIEVDPETDLSAVVRPRTSPLLTSTQTPWGERWVWTTFSADQVDLNFANQDVLFEFLDILLFYVQNGARVVRLDAIAYLWKQIGTTCINLPQTHEVVKLLRDVLEMLAPEVLLLTETNLPHEQNISYFGEADEAHMVYQFSLPPLLLHALHTGTSRYLREWAASLPELPAGCTFLNFTASHDGIGVRPLEGLVPEQDIRQLVEGVHQRGGRVSSYSRPDGTDSPYELNITYYDALSDPGHPDSEHQQARFLCSQSVMLALRGVPAVYFHSLTATHNDHVGVDRTGHARSINRRRWNADELNDLLDDESSAASRIFHEYLHRIRIRCAHPAFHPDGAQRILELGDGLFGVERISPDGSERIICINNLTADSQSCSADAVAPGPRSEVWRDLIEERHVDASGDGTLELAPYEVLWLTIEHSDP